MTAPVPGEIRITDDGIVGWWVPNNGPPCWSTRTGAVASPFTAAALDAATIRWKPETPIRIGELVGQDRAHLTNGDGWAYRWANGFVRTYPPSLGHDESWPVRVLDYGPDTPDDAWGPG